MKIEVNTQNCIEIDFKHSYSDRPVLYITCEKEILDQKIKINDQRFCLNIEEQNAQYYKYKVNFNNLEIIKQDSIQLLDSEYKINPYNNSLVIFSSNSGFNQTECSLYEIPNTKFIEIQNIKSFILNFNKIKAISIFNNLFSWKFHKDIDHNVCIINNKTQYIPEILNLPIGIVFYKHLILKQLNAELIIDTNMYDSVYSLILKCIFNFNFNKNVRELIKIDLNNERNDLIPKYLNWQLINLKSGNIGLKVSITDKAKNYTNIPNLYLNNQYFLQTEMGQKTLKYIYRYTQLYQEFKNSNLLHLELKNSENIPVGKYVKIDNKKYLVVESMFNIKKQNQSINTINKITLKQLITAEIQNLEIENDSLKSGCIINNINNNLAQDLEIQYKLPDDISINLNSENKVKNCHNYVNQKYIINISQNKNIQKFQLTHIKKLHNLKTCILVFNNYFEVNIDDQEIIQHFEDLVLHESRDAMIHGKKYIYTCIYINNGDQFYKITLS